MSKRNLLAASVIAITYKAFDVTVDKIPIAGATINFDRGIFGFLIVITIVYFLLVFVTYYFIDIKNIERTPHQTESERALQSRIASYANETTTRLATRFQRTLSSDYRVMTNDFTGAINEALKGLMTCGFLQRKTEIETAKKARMFHLSKLNEDKTKWEDIPSTEAIQAWKELELLKEKFVRRFWWAYRFNKLRAHLVFAGIRFTYLTRNYFLDGLLPIALGCLSILTLYGILDLSFLQRLSPQ